MTDADVQGVGEKGAFFPYRRWTLLQRLEHITLFTSVLILVYTGFPLKYAHTSWAQTLVNSVGGWENRALLHRVGATMMIGVGIFHVLYHIVWEQKLSPRNIWNHPMMLKPKDALDFIQHWKYNLHLSNEFPKMDRYTWFEKFDYWGAFWGLVIVIGSGLPLWFKEFFVNVLPVRFLSIMSIFHGDEATLAAVFLFTIHWYNVHYNFEVFPATLRWLHGHATTHEMEKYHPLELERIKEKMAKGEAMPPKNQLVETLAPLQRILDRLNSLYPIGIVVFLLLVVFDIYFIKLATHL